jgi:ribosomal-protein-alanine N-acetyltransferase
MIKLVEAAPALAADLAAVHAQAFATPWTALEMVELFDTPGVSGLLVVEGDPLGMMLWRTVVDEAEILTIATAPRARRRGLARAMVEAAVGRARGKGVTAMFLEVAVDNLAAIALYRSLDFREVGTRPGYYDRGALGQVDALVMRRTLNAG